jgi:hypothetical protein
VGNQSPQRSILAVAALRRFPRSIHESVLSDKNFLKDYNLTVDAQISFGESDVAVQQSELFSAIREIFGDGNATPIVKDATGAEWQLQLISKDNERRIALMHGSQRLLLPDFSALSPSQAERMNSFDREANDVQLPEQIAGRWRALLESRALADDEIVTLHTEIKASPIYVSAMADSEIQKGKSSLSTFVPRTQQYFDRLVGEYRQSQNITEYAHESAREHVRELLTWRAYGGFLLSLLISSHSSISLEIEAHQLPEKELIRAYEWLNKKGDRISQIGAAEIGLSILDIRPNIEPYVYDIIEQILNEKVKESPEGDRFQLLSALIVLIEGELSRTQILRGKPPFWRRLASIAQASLIERSIIKSQVDIAAFSKWALVTRTQLFYLQTMTDLRLEPRWYPDYVSAPQLRAELLGRISSAAQKNDSKINNPALRELLFGSSPKSLRAQLNFPLSFLPGPLEGGLESQIDTPKEVLSEIEKQLTEDVLQPHSFTALLNSALIFRLRSDQAQLAASALRSAKYQLRQADNKETLVSVLSGLATVAATTRSSELAQELKILTRRCRQDEGHDLSAEDALWIGLIAAGSHSEIADWCEFVGNWVTELAFQSLQPDEMKRLHSHVEKLCHIVPGLWRTCGRAEAALICSVDFGTGRGGLK